MIWHQTAHHEEHGVTTLKEATSAAHCLSDREYRWAMGPLINMATFGLVRCAVATVTCHQHVCLLPWLCTVQQGLIAIKTSHHVTHSTRGDDNGGVGRQGRRVDTPYIHKDDTLQHTSPAASGMQNRKLSALNSLLNAIDSSTSITWRHNHPVFKKQTSKNKQTSHRQGGESSHIIRQKHPIKKKKHRNIN